MQKGEERMFRKQTEAPGASVWASRKCFMNSFDNLLLLIATSISPLPPHPSLLTGRSELPWLPASTSPGHFVITYVKLNKHLNIFKYMSVRESLSPELKDGR